MMLRRRDCLITFVGIVVRICYSFFLLSFLWERVGRGGSLKKELKKLKTALSLPSPKERRGEKRQKPTTQGRTHALRFILHCPNLPNPQHDGFFQKPAGPPNQAISRCITPLVPTQTRRCVLLPTGMRDFLGHASS